MEVDKPEYIQRFENISAKGLTSTAPPLIRGERRTVQYKFLVDWIVGRRRLQTPEKCTMTQFRLQRNNKAS